MNLNLRNKKVLISGGAKGIGRAAAMGFVEEGAAVALVDRDGTACDALASELSAAGGNVISLKAELSRINDCQKAVQNALAHFGTLDVLVNNAGVNDSVSLEATPEDFISSIERNLLHAFALTHFCLASLKETRGAIVNVSSKVAETGQGRTSGYAAAKGGINALTREWAAALASAGVRVNAVVPAECHTDQYEKWFEQQADPQLAREEVERLVPLGHRLTRPGEIADAILFLASDRASHITGQLLHVDGGYTHLDRAFGQTSRPWGDSL